jgi:hypothetical protein
MTQDQQQKLVILLRDVIKILESDDINKIQWAIGNLEGVADILDNK